ncbi:MAG: hypothetical protein ABIJ84_04320 [bacterium]
MKIIFSNNLKKLKNAINKSNSDFCADYVLFKLTEETNRIKIYLDEKSNLKEIKTKDIYKSFKDDFVDLISSINQNNYSLFWWALNFTNKNPITTDLCNKIFNYLVITRLLKNKNNIIVITDDLNLCKQTSDYIKSQSIELINAISVNFNLKAFIKKVLPVVIIFAYLRILILKLVSIRINKAIKLKPEEKTNVLMTLINHQSFSKNGEYRDAYFGDFPKYLKKKNIPFIILGEVLFPPYTSVLKKAVHNKEGYLIVSKEYFLSIKDLTLSLFKSIARFIKPIKINGPAKINEVDLSYFVAKAIKEDYVSTKFFTNTSFYYCMKRISRLLNIDRFYYPFENRAFEKMSIQAIREFSPGTKIIGYQHASISQRHTNFFLRSDEYKITPIPDLIITMGEISRDIMKNKGNFPENLLRTGCALRQRSFSNERKDKKNKISNLFVALATNIDEYVKVIRFLDEALRNNNSYNIWIRPHPVFSLEEALKISGRPRFKFYKANKEPLEDCYKWADLVLYVHSTLALEALTFGVPVINIVTADCLDPDPLFDFTDLRWSVDNPKKLAETISTIDSIPKDEFKLRQQKAKEYMKKYISPVNESNLKAFIDV